MFLVVSFAAQAKERAKRESLRFLLYTFFNYNCCSVWYDHGCCLVKLADREKAIEKEIGRVREGQKEKLWKCHLMTEQKKEKREGKRNREREREREI